VENREEDIKNINRVPRGGDKTGEDVEKERTLNIITEGEGRDHEHSSSE
jgi:hypothetical protein